MNDEVRKKLESAITACADKSERSNSALDAMQFAQAAANMSNAIAGLEHTAMEKAKFRRN